MTASRTLTLDRLERYGACQDATELFAALFGDSVEVTEELCVTHAMDFSWDWASKNLLSESAQAAYHAAEAQAREDYNAATAPTRASYNAAIADDWVAYDAATAPAWAAYNAAKAPAWARAYINDYSNVFK